MKRNKGKDKAIDKEIEKLEKEKDVVKKMFRGKELEVKRGKKKDPVYKPEEIKIKMPGIDKETLDILKKLELETEALKVKLLAKGVFIDKKAVTFFKNTNTEEKN